MGVAALLAVFLMGSYTGDAQSMARARTKMYRDPGMTFGWELQAPELGLPNYQMTGSGRRITFEDEFTEEDLEEQSEEAPEEGTNQWKGYLREKGPSRLIVRNEVEREPQPLSDEIWALIAGEKKKEVKQGNYQPTEYVKVDENYVRIPNKQIDHPLVENTVEAERLRIDSDVVGDKSMITEDESDAYQKLLELFSRPVVSTPLPGDNEGYVSFRAPTNSTSAFIRKGSRAKFEIKKN